MRYRKRSAQTDCLSWSFLFAVQSRLQVQPDSLKWTSHLQLLLQSRAQSIFNCTFLRSYFSPAQDLLEWKIRSTKRAAYNSEKTRKRNRKAASATALIPPMQLYLFLFHLLLVPAATATASAIIFLLRVPFWSPFSGFRSLADWFSFFFFLQRFSLFLNVFHSSFFCSDFHSFYALWAHPELLKALKILTLRIV